LRLASIQWKLALPVFRAAEWRAAQRAATGVRSRFPAESERAAAVLEHVEEKSRREVWTRLMGVLTGARIRGVFNGCEKGRVFVLDKEVHTRWVQVEGHHMFYYAYQPIAELWRNGTAYYVEVEGKSDMVEVKKARLFELKSSSIESLRRMPLRGMAPTILAIGREFWKKFCDWLSVPKPISRQSGFSQVFTIRGGSTKARACWSGRRRR
jgi:hypothetical protein